MDPADLVEQMLAAPAAVAYLAIAQASGLTSAQAADRHVALALAAAAVDLVGPWRADRERLRVGLRGAVQELRTFADELARRQELEQSWFAPVRRDAQVWIEGRSGGPPRPEAFVDPADPERPHAGWEAYAQKSVGGLYTCTVVDGMHPVLRDGAEGDAGDYHPEPGTPLWRLPVDQDARMFEVRDAWDWHALCARHPMPARETPGAEADEGLVAPDWAAVAADWDAVHLTVGGLLLAAQRTVERDGVRTRHRAWDSEQTLWLRWVFGEPEPFTLQPRDEVVPRMPEWYWSAFSLSAGWADGASRPARRSPRSPGG